ncbi:hepcidin-like [Leuresthes tenuis]|uniref:hepcidin-like n=1 Tax=Leuresthes tenuis TaxID=355514 RepID=UPI003B507015
MKIFSVAVAMAVVLTFICIQESSAAPSSEVHDRVEEMAVHSPVAEKQEMPVEFLKMPYGIGQKRLAGAKCKFCCNCCRLSGCGFCCQF